MLQSVQDHPERWAKALGRALSECLDVLVCNATGDAFVESHTAPGTLYSVSREHCTCAAGMHGQVCKHRACYLAQMGELALPEFVDCPSCNGCGRQWFASGYALPCETCGGSGVKPERRLQGLPAIVPVAAAA